MLDITPSGQACGASVTGVDLSQPLGTATVAEIRAAWLAHHVLAFPDQMLSDDDLERFTLAMGGFGHDPFIAPIPGRDHIIAVERRADEKAPLFAENWHSDWSFQAVPPAGTCLYGITIPPVGGDTLFSNQHAALDAMPAVMRAPLEGRMAIHSAIRAYAPEGMYGQSDASDRSMTIRPSREAEASQHHPLIRAHPETGRLGLFSCFGYIIGIEGMTDDEALPLLIQLYHWQGAKSFNIATAGSRTCWCCGTTAQCCTRQPVAMTAMTGCCTARRLRVFSRRAIQDSRRVWHPKGLQRPPFACANYHAGPQPIVFLVPDCVSYATINPHCLDPSTPFVHRRAPKDIRCAAVAQW